MTQAVSTDWQGSTSVFNHSSSAGTGQPGRAGRHRACLHVGAVPLLCPAACFCAFVAIRTRNYHVLPVLAMRLTVRLCSQCMAIAVDRMRVVEARCRGIKALTMVDDEIDATLPAMVGPTAECPQLRAELAGRARAAALPSRERVVLAQWTILTRLSAREAPRAAVHMRRTYTMAASR